MREYTRKQMAYVIQCDVCSAELERGEGRPAASGRRFAHCDRCTAIEALVDAEIRRRGQVWALETHEKLEEQRKQLRAEMRGQAATTEGWPQSLPPIEVH